MLPTPYHPIVADMTFETAGVFSFHCNILRSLKWDELIESRELIRSQEKASWVRMVLNRILEGKETQKFKKKKKEFFSFLVWEVYQFRNMHKRVLTAVLTNGHGDLCWPVNRVKEGRDRKALTSQQGLLPFTSKGKYWKIKNISGT